MTTTPQDNIPRIPAGEQSEKSYNSEWQGCYGEGWTDITPESFSHPAKFSRALIRRIYRHAIDQGWIKAGDWIIDPFGGSGLGAKDGLYFGINWFGNELEPRFVDMGAGCDCTGISKADWIKFYGRWERFNHKDNRHWCPACLTQARQVIPSPSSQLNLFEKPDSGAAYVRNSGLIPETKPHRYEGNLARFRKHAKGGAVAVLVQGDSRKLAEIVKDRMAAMRSSPPYGNNSKADYAKEERDRQEQGKGSFRGFYGHTEGQLAKLSEGNPDAIIGSLHKAGSRIAQEGGNDAANLRRPTANGRYGHAHGQLGAMADSGFSAVIGSPPFAGNSGGRGEASRNGIDPDLFERHSGGMVGGLGDNNDNLGNMKPGDIEAVIGSPPYADQPTRTGKVDEAAWSDGRSRPVGASQRSSAGYGATDGQLGAMPQGEADAVIGSPPYADSNQDYKNGWATIDTSKGVHDRYSHQREANYGEQSGQRAALTAGDADAVIGSPPFGQATQSGGTNIYNQLEQTHGRKFTDSSRRNGYRAEQQGGEPGQLADLSEGNADAVIGSPPFVGSVGSDDPEKRGGLFRDPKRAGDKNLTGTYGSTPGQLGAMVQGDPGEGHMAAMISSPPYGKDTVNDRNGIDASKFERYGTNSQAVTMNGYGHTPGQLNDLPAGGSLDISLLLDGHPINYQENDKQSKETFWQAAKTIVQQCHEILNPGGVAIWVCKDFVRDGKRVPFCDQWRRLCESVGFEHLETHRAMLVKRKGSQATLEGDLVELKSEHKSFFRRLHESKPGAVRIDWEEVIVLRKPS